MLPGIARSVGWSTRAKKELRCRVDAMRLTSLSTSAAVKEVGLDEYQVGRRRMATVVVATLGHAAWRTFAED